MVFTRVSMVYAGSRQKKIDDVYSAHQHKKYNINQSLTLGKSV